MGSSMSLSPLPVALSLAKAKLASLYMLGFNHHTAPVEVRDRVYFAPEEIPLALQKLKEVGGLEAVLFSTCNRTEVYVLFTPQTLSNPESSTGALSVLPSSPEVRSQKEGENLKFQECPVPIHASENPIGAIATVPVLASFFNKTKNISFEDISKHSFSYQGLECAQHLFRVVASLDSMVVGENQILGQVKKAYAQAQETHSVHVLLNHLFQSAFKAAKRVRTETTINEGAVSISYAAVELARKVLGDLGNKVVGLIGSGEMGELTAFHLARCQVKEFVFFNRSASRAEPLQARFGGIFCPLEDIEKRLSTCDIVVSATGARGLVLTRAQVARAVKQRDGNPLFLIDIAAPRDIEESVAELPDVFLFSIDDLKKVAEENQAARALSSQAAQAILDQELSDLERWLTSLDLVESIKKIRAHYLQITEQEVQKFSLENKLDQAVLAQFAQRLMEKFLHRPLVGLREMGEKQGTDQASETARQLLY